MILKLFFLWYCYEYRFIMGIKGIKKFIESNEDFFLVNCELQSIEFVIDGFNFLYFLFIISKDFDFLYGGDYNEFVIVI